MRLLSVPAVALIAGTALALVATDTAAPVMSGTDPSSGTDLIVPE